MTLCADIILSHNPKVLESDDVKGSSSAHNNP